ncbi:MAG: hypothetical protein WDZ40_01420 [Candidatus Spechtbacterales bacterium]
MKSSRINIAYIGFLILVIVVATLIFKEKSGQKFSLAVEGCNTLETQLRFSCYKNAISGHYKGSNDDFFPWIESQHLSFESADASYAILGTNCHTFYHAVGDIIAEKGSEKDVSELINYCPPSCTSACMMGLYKRNALDKGYPSDLLSKFYEVCPKGSEHSCAHEIGHLLHDKYTYSILRILDELGKDNFNLYPQKEYKYVTFNDPDLSAPFEECKSILPVNELPYCYTGIGHNMFLFSEFKEGGYEESFAECDSLGEGNKDECYDFFVYRIGINDVATKFLSGNVEEGKDICTQVSEDAQNEGVINHCYRGLGGGIGLFIDSEYAGVDIGKGNISQIQRDVVKKINLCEAVGEFKNECYMGILGTGVKKLYKDLNLQHDVIEKIIPQIESDFQVVG